MKNTISYYRNPLLLAAIAFLTFACGSPDKKEELAQLKSQKAELETKIQTLEKELGAGKADSNSRIETVLTQTLQPQTFKHFIEVQGTIDAEQNILVVPKMGGVVTQVLVSEGTQVRTGQTLLVTDDATLRQNMAQLQTGYELAKTIYERQANLWAQKIGSEVQYLQAKNTKEGLERQMSTLQTQINMARVTSPINGTVNMVNVKIGEMAAPGMPVVQVVNLSQMKVKAKIADSYINTVKKGDAVTIQLPDTKEEIQARVTFVSQVVNPLSRTFEIEVALPNKSHTLKPNALAILNINDKTKTDVLIVDQNLVQNTESGDIVYVAATEQGKTVAKSRKISQGLSYNGKVEILEGLQAGDQLITTGSQNLVDGQAIKISQPVASNH